MRILKAVGVVLGYGVFLVGATFASIKIMELVSRQSPEAFMMMFWPFIFLVGCLIGGVVAWANWRPR